VTLRRTVLWCGAGLAALLGIAALSMALAVHRPQLLRPWVQRALTPRGGTASLAGLRLSLAPPVLELSGLAIAGPPHEGDLLRLDLLRFELIPGRLFHDGPWLRHVEARGLVFERPRPREAKGPPDLTPLTRLFDIEDLSLTDARLRRGPAPRRSRRRRGPFEPDPGGRGHSPLHRHRGADLRPEGKHPRPGKTFRRGNVTPVPAIEADLELASARVLLPWLTGDVAGRTRVRVTTTNFHADALTLTLSQGRVRLGPQASRTLGRSA